MVIGSHKIVEYCWGKAVSSPPKNATSAEGCGIVEKSEKWVTYAYNLCEGHMIENNLSAQQFIRRNTSQ